MKAATKKIMLAEAVQQLNETGVLTDAWEFGDDEWVELRAPHTCPLKYIWPNAKEVMQFSRMSEDDPRKAEYNDQHQFMTMIWSFANWLIRDVEGNEIPRVSPQNYDAWFSDLAIQQQIILSLLVAQTWYPKEQVDLPITIDEGDDPLVSDQR